MYYKIHSILSQLNGIKVRGRDSPFSSPRNTMHRLGWNFLINYLIPRRLILSNQSTPDQPELSYICHNFLARVLTTPKDVGI